MMFKHSMARSRMYETIFARAPVVWIKLKVFSIATVFTATSLASVDPKSCLQEPNEY